MNQDRPKSGDTACAANAVEPRGKLARYITIALIVVTLGGVWALVKKSHKPNSNFESTAAPEQLSAQQKNASAAATPTPGGAGDGTLEPPGTAKAATPGALVAVPSRKDLSAEPAAPRPEPSPRTRQLVNSLTQIDLRAGALTPEQASQWKQAMQQLVQEGAGAVPAIREFLERNQDLSFEGIKDGNLSGYSSLRAALFDALQQIGGPEALELSLQTLRSTADPLEVALLSRNLEQQSPGQYRQEALKAARETLKHTAEAAAEAAAEDKPNVRDVAPLFQLLQTYGDAALLSELQKTLPRWNYYATMALAGLPGGEGIPILIRELQDPAAATTGARNFTLQMLAQGAAQYPDAAVALVEQARLNQISDWAWRQVGRALGGEQDQFGSQFFDNKLPPPSGEGVRTHHIESGNQNFYTTPVAADLSADQINQRLALIDQLLGVTSKPAAVSALQGARSLLSSGSR